MKRMPLYILMGALLCGLPLVCNPYWLDVCVMIGLYALLALSLNVILGQAGIFHMGHAAFYAVGAYVTAILNTLCHWPIFWTMPLAGAAAALFALLVARPIIHLRGDYLLIVTIGIVEIVRIALINDVFGLTGGSNGIFGISRPRFFGYKIVKSVQFYYLVWGMVGVSLLLFYGLWRSRFGRALNYIKEDDVAAEGCGVNVTRAGLCAGGLLGGHGGHGLRRENGHHRAGILQLHGIGDHFRGGHPFRRQPIGRAGQRFSVHRPAGSAARVFRRAHADLRSGHDGDDDLAAAGPAAARSAPLRRAPGHSSPAAGCAAGPSAAPPGGCRARA